MALFSQKKLDPYAAYGAYNWYAFNHRVTYTQHVKFLKRWITDKNVIDIGAGDGLITHELGIKGIDNSRYAVDIAALKGVKIDLGDARRLPYRREQFDAALMSDLLPQFKSIAKPLAEARRVIKKYLCVSIPMGERHIENNYERYWSADEIIAEAKKQGLALVDGPRVRPDRVRTYMKFEKV